MDFEYQRDLEHHYFIINVEDNNNKGYELSMLKRNDVRGILSCQIRYRNGMKKYCYDISGKQSLEQIYSVGKMNAGELRSLFYQIEEVIRELGRYLLDNSKLLIGTEHIYKEAGGREYYFLYFPENKENMNTQIERFAENLLNIADHEDEDAVKAAYEFYNRAGEASFTFSAMTDYMNSMEKGVKTEIQEESEIIEVEEEETETEIEEELSEPEEKTKEPVSDRIKKAGKIIIGAILFLCAAGVYLMENYVFTTLEITAMAAGLAAVCTISAVCFGKRLWREKKKENEKKEIVITEQPEITEEVEAYPEETTFFGMEDWEQEKTLEGRIKGRRIEIRIDKSPFVIGKEKDSVSYILQDSSISRIHAKFIEEEGRLFLSDLNSKNGTFKNGVQLNGGDKAEVFTGDEIRFGRVRFTYY